MGAYGTWISLFFFHFLCTKLIITFVYKQLKAYNISMYTVMYNVHDMLIRAAFLTPTFDKYEQNNL